VATRLLDAGGVEAVTLREVGRQAGVSHNAPYKHFASKEALLAAIAAQELTSHMRQAGSVRALMHNYAAWALKYPHRFKLVFGTWTIDSPELTVAATDAQRRMVELVADAQAAGELPAGDPVRLASLIRAVTHGAADLAAAGHLAAGGKGNADPEDLVDDLLGYLLQQAGHPPIG
jgi:AcrR family transcriptional regulator